MKKQILILFMALFALGSTQVYAQPPAEIILPPTPLDETCIDLEDPLNVVAGQPYTYEVSVPSPPGDKTYHWFVTQDTQFIEDGGIVATSEVLETSTILAAGSAHYDTPTVDEETIELTFQSFTLAEDDYVFVVIYVENEDDCITNNLKVYRIQPLHAFTLDIANIDFTDWTLADDPFEQCIDDVQDASFDPTHGANGGVVYDFGQNTFYYVVAAANFSGGYQLSYQFDGLQGPTADGALGQQAIITWHNDLPELVAGTGSLGTTTITDDETTGAVLGVIPVQNVDGFVGSDGEMLYIQIVIEHRQFEGADDQDSWEYNFALDGVLVDDANNPLNPDDFGDLFHDTCDRDPFHNAVAQVLTARPTILPVDPDEFLPNAP